MTMDHDEILEKMDISNPKQIKKKISYKALSAIVYNVQSIDALYTELEWIEQNKDSIGCEICHQFSEENIDNVEIQSLLEKVVNEFLIVLNSKLKTQITELTKELKDKFGFEYDRTKKFDFLEYPVEKEKIKKSKKNNPTDKQSKSCPYDDFGKPKDLDLDKIRDDIWKKNKWKTYIDNIGMPPTKTIYTSDTV